MNVKCEKKKLRKALEDEQECVRAYGRDMAKRIYLRLNQLSAADNLGVFWPPLSLPNRCHELKGDRKGVFSMDLVQPYRLLFKAVGEPDPPPEDQRLRWLGIETVEIIGIEDTHG